MTAHPEYDRKLAVQLASIVGVVGLAITMLIFACATTASFPEEGPAAKLYRSYGVPLEMAEGVHESIRIAGRQAADAGVLEGEDLEKVKSLINSSATAINAAKDTLQLLQEGGISTDLSNLDNAHQSIRNLIKLAVELGFWKE